MELVASHRDGARWFPGASCLLASASQSWILSCLTHTWVVSPSTVSLALLGDAPITEPFRWERGCYTKEALTGSIQATLILGQGSFKVVRAERKTMFYKQAPPPESSIHFQAARSILKWGGSHRQNGTLEGAFGKSPLPSILSLLGLLWCLSKISTIGVTVLY